MAKKFNNLERNSNTGSVLDGITSLVGNPNNITTEERTKVYSYKMSEEVHSILKYDLCKKYNTSIHGLITKALISTYDELK